MAYLVVKDLKKTYVQSTNGTDSSNVLALDGISFQLEQGEFVTLFGPNGSGKTTLLNCISGIIDPDSGSITIAGKSARLAKTACVFQDYRGSLLPWRRVIDNIAFPLELRGIAKPARHMQAKELIKQLDIDVNLTSYPYQLSGGQQQMVSILRALVERPDVVLLDEPFSALDYETRLSMQDSLLDIWQRTNATIIFISHDIDEAIYLADKVLLLSHSPGRIIETENILSHFTRPRSHRIVETEMFFRIRAHFLSKLWGTKI